MEPGLGRQGHRRRNAWAMTETGRGTGTMTGIVTPARPTAVCLLEPGSAGCLG